MAKIRVKVQPPDSDNNSYHVHLPTYIIVPGTEIYDKENKLISVEVQVPDDECNADGKLSPEKIRAKYRGQSRWDRPDVAENVLTES